MPIAYMQRVTIPDYENRIDNKGFEYQETLTSSGNGDSVIIPDCVSKISVTLEITGGGSGRIQATTNLLQDVLDDNNVVWIDWDNGVVAASTQDAMEPATAIRVVNVSGTTRIMARAQ